MGHLAAWVMLSSQGLEVAHVAGWSMWYPGTLFGSCGWVALHYHQLSPVYDPGSWSTKQVYSTDRASNNSLPEGPA